MFAKLATVHSCLCSQNWPLSTALCVRKTGYCSQLSVCVQNLLLFTALCVCVQNLLLFAALCAEHLLLLTVLYVQNLLLFTALCVRKTCYCPQLFVCAKLATVHSVMSASLQLSTGLYPQTCDYLPLLLGGVQVQGGKINKRFLKTATIPRL